MADRPNSSIVDQVAFAQLFGSEGQSALHVAVELQPQEKDFLAHFQSLSRHFPAELARTALEIAILRRQSASKFPAEVAEKLYWTREALEQASAYAVSTYRAGRFRQHGSQYLLDLGCAAGGDTLAFAQHMSTIGVDLDPLRLAMAQANLKALGRPARFIQADLRQPLPWALGEQTALFFDPARRSHGRRIFSVQDYQPPLWQALDWQKHSPALGIKVSPGVKLAELTDYPAEIEFISLNGDLKEAALWFGPLRQNQRRATLLPGEHSLTDASPLEKLPIQSPLAFIYEPDPAVLRAGLVAHLGTQLGAVQLDPDIAYLTSEKRVETPFARCWAVRDWLPFQLKRLRAWLRQHKIGQVVVKKRGSPLEPEQLIQDLRLERSHSDQVVLFLTHWAGQPIVVIADPIPAP